jgi:hypothetical protein
MGRFLVLFFALMSAMTGLANAGQCTLDPRVIVATSPYFATQMVVKQVSPASLTLQHKDDGRFIVNFAMETPPYAGGQSLTKYLNSVRKDNESYLSSLKAKGRWAELATFPADPVSWRLVEETNVTDVGPALQGRMYIRFNDDCMLTANFLAPSSVNLMEKWHSFNAAITDLRASAVHFVVPGVWGNEDTTPTGANAIIGGFGVPLAIAVVAYFLLGHLTRLDPPSALTRVVLVCAGVVALGGFGVQFKAYQEELVALRYTDNALLLLTCALLSFLSLAFAQKVTVASLLVSCISGIALVTMGYVDWTPDPTINTLVGASLIIMSTLGFLSWSAHSRTVAPKGTRL